MSQKKTVIQGLVPDEKKIGGAMGGAASNFYTRGNRQASRGTVVPGMMDANAASNSNQASPEDPQPRKSFQTARPIVGFLYSVSRTPAGEYWPLKIGRNTIGQSANSNIILLEGTVSSEHAVIIVRQIKSTGNVIAAITDTQSTNGTLINGETIGFSAVECHNGDVITVGSNYELVLIMIDAAKLGLTVSKDFIPIETEEEDEEEDDVPDFNNGSTNPGGFNPYDNGPTAWGNDKGKSPAGGTVGMDGSVSGNNHGGTIPM